MTTETVLISFEVKGKWKLTFVAFILKLVDRINIPSFKKKDKKTVVINLRVLYEP